VNFKFADTPSISFISNQYLSFWYVIIAHFAARVPSNTNTMAMPANGEAQSNGTLHNKLLDQVVRTPDRRPSPQPTHLSVPGQVHKVLQEEGSGYVAPKFEGKEQQMEA
jgi:hypothetical protein